MIRTSVKRLRCGYSLIECFVEGSGVKWNAADAEKKIHPRFGEVPKGELIRINQPVNKQHHSSPSLQLQLRKLL